MGAGAVIVLWAALALWGVAFAQPAGFADVGEDAFYSLPVASLAERGVFAGTGCDEGFCPGEAIDRKTMAVWTVRVLDGEDPPAVVRTRFDDVDAAGFHAPFIERMAELEVTLGCGDGTVFCPDRVVSRAEMAVFLARAYDLPDGTDPGFSDVADEAWYAADVARLAASEITVGCGDGTVFCPSRDTTRAEMATFLYRAENRPDAEQPPDDNGGGGSGGGGGGGGGSGLGGGGSGGDGGGGSGGGDPVEETVDPPPQPSAVTFAAAGSSRAGARTDPDAVAMRIAWTSGLARDELLFAELQTRPSDVDWTHESVRVEQIDGRDDGGGGGSMAS